MGYRAFLTLTIGTNQDTELIKEFNDGYVNSPFGENGYCDMDVNQSMIDEIIQRFKKFSEAHHGILFTIYGEGSSSDYWNLYFKDGKMQEATGEIIIPDFDETKLEA